MYIRPFSKSYGEKTVLKISGLTLKEGQIHALIGANGSGKSTLAKILAGIIRPDQKEPIFEKTYKAAYMPQKSYAFRMSTFKNIMLGGDDEKRAAAYMGELDILSLKDQRADRLSGGETARMALARSLMRPYDLVILDEPTAAMDITSAINAEKMILNYRDENKCTMIIITHNLKQVRRIADQVIFLSHGEVVEMGTAAKVLDDPSEDETVRFLDYIG